MNHDAPLRSLLFVPGYSERKQARALASPADALILDLEDSVDPAQLPVARQRVAQLLRARGTGAAPQLWVRVNPPSAAPCREDLQALFAPASGALAGLVLPKVSSATELVELAGELGALEARSGAAPGATRLVVIATETPQGLLGLPQYVAILGAAPQALARLAGLTWGAEDLGAALGALDKRDAAGELTFTFQLARSSCLLAAGALGVQAIDGVYTDFNDAAGLHDELSSARRDGFSGKLAIHPGQVSAINEAFTPSEAECEHARRVVAAFAAAPGAGVVSLDGRMIDRPHLVQARRVLASAPPGRRAVTGG
ncbi:MAG TPA: CoA ester lyase [Candidatus Dormibacteraeota bacterium]|nr:CoA ester lyase [Candidatus Dormibacteraeota bacterium]